jgi:hypothetical protein
VQVSVTSDIYCTVLICWDTCKEVEGLV